MTEYKNDIVIAGTGKVAYHLGTYLSAQGYSIMGVWGRTPQKSRELSKLLHTESLPLLSNIPENTLVLVCVADSAIAEVVQLLPDTVQIAYTSGSVQLEDLPTKPSLGVFYPLQTFSKEKKVDISAVPFLIESKNKAFETALFNLASTMSNKVCIANSQERYFIHIAAVMVNNFTNFLYLLAKEHLTENQLDFEILIPLIKETVDKLNYLSPKEAQTGPAVRGDLTVIKKHLDTISNPDTKEIYQLFSNLITKEFKKNEL